MVAGLTARLDALEAENRVLRAANAELKRRLGLDSRKLVEAAVTDSPLAKPAPKSLRRKSGPSRAATWASGVNAGGTELRWSAPLA